MNRPGADPPYDARYMLRYAIPHYIWKLVTDVNLHLSFSPETVESLFIAYRLTGNQRYRDHGWDIFQAIEKHCRIESGGYATVLNVDEVPARHDDKMETFLMVKFSRFSPAVMN